MPFLTALRAWLAMVPTIALALDIRLEIVVLDGLLDVIETKKPKKVSQISTREQYQLEIGQGISPLYKNCPSWLSTLIL